MKKLVIVKLGGSVLTDKTRPKSLDRSNLKRLAAELASAQKKKGFSLLVVHGGGAFGHSIAKRFGVHKGQGGAKGWAETHTAMQEFNLEVVKALQNEGLPAIEFQPSATAIQYCTRLSDFYLKALHSFIQAGLVPVCYGDAVADEHQTVSILSGDQLVSFLARKLKVSKVVLTTDVDGVFDEDPRKPTAKLVAWLYPEKTVKTGRTKGTDVTGGMGTKIEELLTLASEGVPSLIVNGKKKDRLRKALIGEDTPGTRICQTI